MSSFLTRIGGGSRRRGAVVATVVGVVVALAALALLALPMLGVPGDAQAAKNDLTAAKSALAEGDIAHARKLVSGARDHVDAAQGGVGGLGGDLLSVLPVAGTAVNDARHLVQALDDATAVAEIGADLYPSVAGEHATLFSDGQIDEATLDRVVAKAHQIGDHLSSAQTALGDVHGTSPFIGATIKARRDDAAAQVDPMADSFAKVEPALDRLPAVFGFDGTRHYLVALLNPAELRYSGGAALTFAPLTLEEGKIDFGKSVKPLDDQRLRTPISWRRVRGNPLHHRGDQLLVNSTFAPSWSVSGTELLRAWRTARGRQHDGLIVVDVVALAHLFGVTGGVTVPGYGKLTEDNLVKTLIGSYDQYYPDATAQDRLSEGIIPAFESQLFGGGHYVEKAQALGDAADGRHFALYFRDPEVQDSFAALGLDGNLAAPDHDYLGVFTQNTNASKTDYYQRRSVSLEVSLRKDGSAEHKLDVTVDNDTPPYFPPGVDPQIGYFTRWSGLSLGVFLPDGVKVDRTTVRGESKDLVVRNFYDHDFIAPQMMLEPSSQGQAHVEYRVKDAATVGQSGDLTYRLSVDPQGMVNPESATVTVHLPHGYRAKVVPPGWSADGSTLTFPAQALSTSQQWEIVARPGN